MKSGVRQPPSLSIYPQATEPDYHSHSTVRVIRHTTPGWVGRSGAASSIVSE